MPVEQGELSWNANLIADFREHDGQITQGRLAGSNMLLLTTTGARTGTARTVPLGYSRDGQTYIVVGSNSGKVDHPQWLANIAANPTVTVEVGTQKYEAKATITKDPERQRLFDAQAKVMPTFNDYQKATTRQIPVIVLEPM